MDKIFINKNHITLSYINLQLGDCVVVKPNLVKESKETDPTEWESVITSPPVV